MAKLTHQVEINVPKNKVWEILADFGNVSKWAPIVTQSSAIGSSNQGVGAERSCEIVQMGTVTEKAVEWDEGNSVKYEVKGLPSVNSFFNKFSLRGEADQTVVTLEGEVDIAGTEEQRKGFEEQLQGAVQMTLQGLKQYAETGQKMTPPPMP